MNAKQFNAALEALQIENHSAASRILGIARRSVIHYAQDEREVPESVRRLLIMLTKHGVPKEFAQ